MAEPPILSAPKPEEVLIMYLAISNIATSAALIRKEGKRQYPVFYTILTNYPIWGILSKLDLSGRITKWAIELSSFDITYEPRVSHKGQAVDDFLLEYEDTPEEPVHPEPQWELRVDGSSNQASAGVGVVMLTPEGPKLQQSICLKFPAMNNKAEYEALLAGLRLASSVQVPRVENTEADQLATSASSSNEDLARTVPIDVLTSPALILRRKFLPEMFKPTEALVVLKQIHDGDCGNHSGGRSLTHKVLTQGYFWPYLARNAEQYTRRYDKCQRHGPMKHQPAEDLHAMANPWPFAQWGIDMVGPLPKTVEQKEYVLLATDYFTKWVEAEAYSSVTHEQLAAISHPQGNGQAEITNRTIFSYLKKKLEKLKTKWYENLPQVLWAYRTTPRRPTGESPFAMAYGSEAVIPTEAAVPTLRTSLLIEGNNS
ncbi:uncharacterized protein LOC132316201 [Cornus florida]|uniref:uncharacterized protein LOC132316201 n=1 Tax=Cornus florida TaxID=4283 RepID=UPI0028A296F1|nr:uncharacterized protein LOC132316201 [Cornus florida]